MMEIGGGDSAPLHCLADDDKITNKKSGWPASICRVCSKKCSPNLEAQSLFGVSSETGVPFHRMIMALCTVRISSDDRLPHGLCIVCAEETIKAYAFKINCEKTHSKFEKFVKDRDARREKNSDIKEEIPDFQIEDYRDADDILGDPYQNFDLKIDKVKIEEFIDESETVLFENESIPFKKGNRPIERKKKKDRRKKEIRNIETVSGNGDEEKKFLCDECDFRTKRKCSLDLHKKQHTGEKLFHCDLCPYRAIQKAKLDNHTMMVHTRERPFGCDQCSYRCVSALKLREHERVHTGEKSFLCDECDYRCVTLAVLNKHKSSRHSDEKNFACDECDFKTKTMNTLKIHKKRHSGEKRFACELCSFRAIQKCRLDVHIKMVHTGERPFACELCSYRCADSNYLKIHRRNHSVKKYSCDECGYSCHTRFRLKTHKYMHSGEKPHGCDLCNFKTTRNSILQKHLERIHNTELKEKFQNNFGTAIETM